MQHSVNNSRNVSTSRPTEGKKVRCSVLCGYISNCQVVTQSATHSCAIPIWCTADHSDCVAYSTMRPCSHHNFGTGTEPERNRAPVFTPVLLGPVVPERANHLTMWSQWNRSSWLCRVNAQPDAFRPRLASPCVIMKNMQYIFGAIQGFVT